MHHAEFGAAMQGRENFAWIETPLWIEGAFDALLLIEICFGEHLAHQIAFLDSDAMFTAQHPAHGDAETQNIETQLLGAFDISFLCRIVEDQRVKIAVSGMKDIGDAERVFGG